MSKSPAEPTVFVVDDDQEVRNSLRYLLESANRPVQSFASAEEFLAAYDPAQPGCLVLDLRMPGLSGLELQDRLRASGVRIPVIMVSAFGDVPSATRSMRAGAVTFIEKPWRDSVLLESIDEALALDEELRRWQARRDEILERLARLTPRQRQVLDLLVCGMTSREMALRLGISHKTVDIHRAQVNRKMDVTSIAELVAMMLELREGVPGGGDAGDGRRTGEGKRGPREG